MDIVAGPPTRALSASGVLSKYLKIIYDDKEISELWLAQCHVRNSGRDPIEKLPVRWSVYADNDGIELGTQPFWDELEKEIKVERFETEHRMSFTVPFLNPSEELLVYIYFSGPITSHQVVCRQAGLIVRQGESWSTPERSLWSVIKAENIGIAVGAGLVASLVASVLNSIGDMRARSDESFRQQLEDIRRLSNSQPLLDKNGTPLSDESVQPSAKPSAPAQHP